MTASIELVHPVFHDSDWHGRARARVRAGLFFEQTRRAFTQQCTDSLRA